MSCNLICQTCEGESYDDKTRTKDQIGVITDVVETIKPDGTVLTEFICEHGHIDSYYSRAPVDGKHKHKGYDYWHSVERKHKGESMNECGICKDVKETETVMLLDEHNKPEEIELCKGCIEFGTSLLGRPPVLKKDIKEVSTRE